MLMEQNRDGKVRAISSCINKCVGEIPLVDTGGNRPAVFFLMNLSNHCIIKPALSTKQ